MRTSDYRAAARAVLQGKWLKMAAILLLAGLLGASVGGPGSSITSFDVNYNVPSETVAVIPNNMEFYKALSIAMVFAVVFLVYLVLLGSYVTVGLAGLGSRVLDGENPRVGMLFPKGVFWKAVGMNIVRGLLISLGFFLLIIPGIIFTYSYSMADYILYNHPEMGVMEVLRESKKRMYGHRMGLFVLELSFIGWSLLASLPAMAAAFAIESASFWTIYGIGTFVSLIAGLFVQTYMHVSFIAYFRNVDRASVWKSQARAGEEEFVHAQYGEAEDENAEGNSFRPEPAPYVDTGVARSLFMEYGCSHVQLREAGMMDEYEQMQIDSSMEAGWIRDYAQSLMLRFDRDALVLDKLLALAGEYALVDLVSRVLERIERHIRQQTLPDAEILNMAGRVLALLVSGAFADNEGFVQRKKQQISEMADKLEARLAETGEGEWQNALHLIRSMCA